MENKIFHSAIKKSFTHAIKPGIVNFYFTDKNKERYYFKANNNHTFDYNEIMANIISKSLGISPLNFVPCTYIDASKKEHKGLLSKDYHKNRADIEIFNLNTLISKYERYNFELTVENVINMLSFHVYKELKVNNKEIVLDESIENNLNKTTLLLYLTGQQDHNGSNFEFKIEKNNNNKYILSALPYIDNSLTFFTSCGNTDIFENYCKNPEDTLKDFIFPLVLRDSRYERSNFERVSRELALEICNSEDMKEAFVNVFKLDFKKEIDDYCKKNNFKIEKQNIDKALIFFEKSKSILKEKVALVDKSLAKEVETNSLESQYDLAQGL